MAGIKTGRPPEAQHAEAIHSSDEKNMAEPDDLYTLRAQFWLGHYDMVRDEFSVVGLLVLVSESTGQFETNSTSCAVVPILGARFLGGSRGGETETERESRCVLGGRIGTVE